MARETPYPEIDIGQVRQYVQSRADRSSVRAVAADIGMRHTTLSKFLEGSEPYPKNRVLIIEWYLRQYQVSPSRDRMQVPTGISERIQAQLVEADPEAHLEALLSDLRGEARSEARLRITTAIAHAYRRMGRPTPRWLYKDVTGSR